MLSKPEGNRTVEIDITEFFESADAFEFSASVAERGKNAGTETWQNAKDEGARAPLLKTPEEIDALRAYVKDFGAWEPEDIAAWSPVECNALFIQLVSGDMREAGLDNEPDESDWREYETRAERGNCTGNIFKTEDGQVFYSLSR